MQQIIGFDIRFISSLTAVKNEIKQEFTRAKWQNLNFELTNWSAINRILN